MYEQQLRSAKHSGLYHLPPTRRTMLEKAAGKLGLPLLPANLAACRETAEALRQLGTALRFPAWYGANFDALFDCLTDPDWQAGTGIIVLLEGSDALRQAEPEDFSTLLEVFQAAVEAHRTMGTPCWILLGSPTPGVAPLPEA